MHQFLYSSRMQRPKSLASVLVGARLMWMWYTSKAAIYFLINWSNNLEESSNRCSRIIWNLCILTRYSTPSNLQLWTQWGCINFRMRSSRWKVGSINKHCFKPYATMLLKVSRESTKLKQMVPLDQTWYFKDNGITK